MKVISALLFILAGIVIGHFIGRFRTVWAMAKRIDGTITSIDGDKLTVVFDKTDPNLNTPIFMFRNQNK